MCDFELSSLNEKMHKKLQDCKPYRNMSLGEMVNKIKSNPYSPPLSEIIITDHSTGETYTAEEVDRVLNN
jgi:hypothetical protein